MGANTKPPKNVKGLSEMSKRSETHVRSNESKIYKHEEIQKTRSHAYLAVNVAILRVHDQRRRVACVGHEHQSTRR